MDLFYIDQAGHRGNAFEQALLHAAASALRSGTKEVAIAVHHQDDVASSAIEDVLGKARTRSLVRGTCELEGLRLCLVTERRRGDFTSGPMIAAYVSPQFLPRLLSDERVTEVVFLPWTASEQDGFVSRYRPTPIDNENRES